MSESVDRLRAATKPNVLSALGGQAAVGRVSEEDVSLQRAIPLVGNSYKPFFVGRFESEVGGVFLVGQFTTHWGVKIFNAIWFGFCILWTVLATFNVVAQPDQWFLPLFGFRHADD